MAVRQDALHPARGDRVMRVLLANAQQRVPTGGGNFVTLEELVREHGEVRVCVWGEKGSTLQLTTALPSALPPG